MIANADRFASRAATYERYRPRFPETLLTLLRQRCRLDATHRVADVGAGTGMLAELFLQNRNPVTAVEPNAEMRAACELLLAAYPGFKVVAATAEETTLPSHSVDFVVVGRAFHWFDRDRALAEFSRILVPGGWLVLITSQWGGDGSAVSVEFEDILKTNGIDYDKVLQALLTEDDAKRMFLPDRVFFEELHAREPLTSEQLSGRAATLSVTPLPDHPLYPAFRSALDAYFERHAQRGVLSMMNSYRLIGGQLSLPGELAAGRG